MTTDGPLLDPAPLDAHRRRWGRAHEATAIPSAPTGWSRLGPARRGRLVTGSWVVVALLLGLGLFDERAYVLVVAASAVHALVFLALLGGRPMVFPAQLRIAYLALVTVGTVVPGLHGVMVIATLGAVALLAFDYCPLARLLYLLPWNRAHALTPRLIWATVIAAPGPGRFRLAPAVVEAHLAG